MARTRGRAPAHSGRLPTFLIIGVPKAGTSALAAWLAGHPEVFMVPGKELHFFTTGFWKGLDWYRAHFPANSEKQQFGEASPGYLFSERALPRMVDAVPDAKLIAILRHPVDRAYSHYWMLRSKFPHNRSFEELARLELDGKRDDTSPPLLAMGRYMPQLERVDEFYGPERLLVVLYDDLAERPKDVFENVCGYLDVDRTWTDPIIGSVVNATTMVRSGRLRLAMMKLRMGRWLPRRIVYGLDRLNRVKGTYPPMDPSLRSELLDWFRDDVEALSRRLGRDLSAWQK